MRLSSWKFTADTGTLYSTPRFMCFTAVFVFPEGQILQFFSFFSRITDLLVWVFVRHRSHVRKLMIKTGTVEMIPHRQVVFTQTWGRSETSSNICFNAGATVRTAKVTARCSHAGLRRTFTLPSHFDWCRHQMFQWGFMALKLPPFNKYTELHPRAAVTAQQTK